MALNIKDAETERLAAEVAHLAGESKTRAVKTALAERRSRLALGVQTADRSKDLVRFLEEEVWPRVPRSELGRRWSRSKEEKLLGYGKEGV